jgi:hypothetical protein
MNQINSLFTLRLEPNVLLDLIVGMLENDGLRVICSFDLQAACASFEANICPHHGQAPCDCQMLVMLVYAEEGDPLALVAHGHMGRVQVGIREESVGANHALETRVRSLLGVNRIVKEVRQLKLATG